VLALRVVRPAGSVASGRRWAVRMVCGLCQGESGFGASLGAPVAMSDRQLRLPAAGQVFRGETCCVHATGLDPVVLSESGPSGIVCGPGGGVWCPVVS
jgi:hypothetical protein